MNERYIRKLSGYKNQLKINVPAEFGFMPNDYIEIIKESDNVFKIIKVDVVPKETTNEKEIKEENVVKETKEEKLNDNK